MKTLFNSLLVLTIVVIAGCSKEKPPQKTPAPASIPEPQLLKKEIQTLHKAEDLKDSAVDDIAAQHKQIEAATQ